MNLKSTWLCLLIWVIWYIIGQFHYEFNLIKNTTYTIDGFYRTIDEKRYGTPQDIIQNISDNFLNNDWSASSSSWDGIYYCSQVRTEEQEVKLFGNSYIKIGSDIFSAWKKIASCNQSNCSINGDFPNIFYDWKNTFYRWELLSWFDYNNLVVLDQAFSVFTDKNKVYFQWTELPDMDWATFSHPKKNIQEFKDKNYTYTFVSSETGMQVQRIENKQ